MEIIDFIRKEMLLEAQAIKEAAARVDADFEKAIDLILNCNGKVVVAGMGKTGIIGRKISATLASTGTTSTFLHAAEGIHGDLGILDKRDVVIAISYTGNTSELISILPFIKFNKIPIIAITGNKKSKLAKNADLVLDCWVPKESEPFGLVPTASTTVALAIGDALAVALLKKRDFCENDFARYHPGGTIGKKLLLRVKDLMHSGEANPVVTNKVMMDEVVMEMTRKKLGSTNVIDDDGFLVGIVTDGDLRRFLAMGITDLKRRVEDVMVHNPKSVHPETLAVDALNLMEDNKITMLPVIDENNKPVAMLHMHDLINAGVVG